MMRKVLSTVLAFTIAGTPVAAAAAQSNALSLRSTPVLEETNELGILAGAGIAYLALALMIAGFVLGVTNDGNNEPESP